MICWFDLVYTSSLDLPRWVGLWNVSKIILSGLTTSKPINHPFCVNIDLTVNALQNSRPSDFSPPFFSSEPSNEKLGVGWHVASTCLLDWLAKALNCKWLVNGTHLSSCLARHSRSALYGRNSLMIVSFLMVTVTDLSDRNEQNF